MDRTKVLYSPQIQTYGKTNYLKEIYVLGRTKVLYLWGNQLLRRNLSFGQNQGIAWSSESNPWGNQLLKRKLCFGQNQGIAWFSDSHLWGNQLLKRNLCFGLNQGIVPLGKPTI